MRFEITFLDSAGEQTTRTVDAAEIDSLLERAGRTGAHVGIRPCTPCPADSDVEADTAR